MSILIADRWGNDVTEERAVTTTSSLTAPAEWLMEAFGGSSTSSGIHVGRDVALTIDSVFKAVGLISTDMAKRKLTLYQLKNGVKRCADEHPAYWMMRHKSSKYQRAFDYKQQLTMHKLLYGASFAYKVFKGGRVVESLPLLPDTVSVRNTRDGLMYDVMLYFDDGTGEVFTFDRSQIVHETWLSYDGVNGIGVLKTAKELLGRMVAMRNYGTTFFKNSARPATVIMRPTDFKDDAARQAFITSWERMYSGTANAHKTALLPPGAEIKTISSTARDSQLDEQEERMIKQVANHFLMPGSKLNSAIAAGYKSLEQDDLQYRNDCLHGHEVSFEDTCNDAFLTEEEIRDGYFFEFDQDRYRSADLKSLGEFFSKALGNNNPWMVPNQIRAVFGDNPIEGGDELPRNNIAGTPAPDPSGDMSGETTQVEDTEIEDSARAIARDAIQRVVTRLTDKAKRGYKEGGEVGALAAVDCRNCERVKEMLAPSLRMVSLVTRKEPTNESAITIELFAAVREAAKNGPDAFADSLNELTAGIAERLAA